MTELDHGRPGRGDQAARARALHAGRGVLPPAPVGQVEVLGVAQRLGAEAEHGRSLEGVAVLVGVGRNGGHAGHPVVEDVDVVTELLAEGQDEPAQAPVDVQPHALLEGDLGQIGDGVDRAVAVVAGRADERHRLVVRVLAHPVDVHLGGEGIDRRPPQLDPEEVARLVEGRVCRLGLDHVGTGHPPGLGGVLAVGQDGVQDAAGAPGGDQATGVVAGLGGGVPVVQAQRHGDDLGLELGGARAHVALQDVDVGEQAEGLGHEPVVVVVAAVHRARALARLPEGVLLGRHGAQLRQHLLPAHALVGQLAVDGEAVGVGVVAHDGGPPSGGAAGPPGRHPGRRRETRQFN